MNELPPPPSPLALPPAGGGSEPAPQPPQPDASQGSQRWDDRLAEIWRTRPRRFPKHGYLAGVCAGFAWRYAIDPLVVRIAFVLSTVFGGVGITLYLAAWLLLPRNADEASALGALFGRRTSSVAKWKTVLLTLALLVSLGGIGWHDVYPGALWLAGWFLAVWFLHRRTPIPPEGVPSAAASPGDPGLAQAVAQAPAVSPRRRRGLWAVVAVVFLLPLAGGLTFFAWAFSADKPDGKIGDRTFIARTDGELQDAYGVSVGQVSLNLRDLALVRDRTVRVSVRTGEVQVSVPENANVRAVCHVGVGSAGCGGFDEAKPGEPTLTLELTADLGSVHVWRGAPPRFSDDGGGERRHRQGR
ncbi:PspC domain-containing protein [Segniliparus rugosus]|uniref:Phage shock protein PspC N-terminal domain-containing protein n=1 Tax=Segniliparus rugosus (strain ATCC BAA-974 / DSM 45345 / CCUG 50838 / CIP 108380 / JCM 13579 / CDC 945) TaxID=679197 RepID=E5XM11_SEGRC|nr:PspC domain-containing protein [Segniliparus rugosus]EFV14617.2 hypothetical protein HMPREF9336_00530 [Segniliparus rugosus ATCC BAA-974]